MAAEQPSPAVMSQPEEAAEERDEGGLRETMKPWEQHSAVISIPRFDYNAPSYLLRSSCSGFLVTCPIKREKSATKEAISIFEKFVIPCISDCSEGDDADVILKRRKSCPSDGDVTFSVESKLAIETETSLTGELSGQVQSTVQKSKDNNEQKHILSLVKLTRSGLLLFIFAKDYSGFPVSILSDICRSLECGDLKRPLWCHRIFPIQATSVLKEKEVGAVVSKLVLEFVNDNHDKLSTPLKFAVSYDRRGIEETELKGYQSKSDDPSLFALLGRSKCFSVVAAAVKEAVSDSVVDLKSPELSVFIELLPLSRMANGSLVVAISVLPKDLVSVKPRLSVKALASDSKARGGGN